MIKRRARAIGLSDAIGNHTFRATGITATDDLSAVQRNWKRAFDEARQAFLSDSQDVRAGDQVATLPGKLRSLRVPR
jgi:hypothetical protein